MRIAKILALVLMLAATTSACSLGTKRDDLKSPCVGAEDSPCGPRRAINAWWQA
jgi:hypothetical protein